MERSPRTAGVFFGVVLAVVAASGGPGDAAAEFRGADPARVGSLCGGVDARDKPRAECYKCPAGDHLDGAAARRHGR